MMLFSGTLNSYSGWSLSEPVYKILAGPLPTTVGGSQALVSIGLGIEEEEGLGRGQRP